ncbi:branched-chain amino acid ABC transporter permease [Micromonospora sp. NPDC049275]|uniref:branched-chain amino acid ABC transporter permease n=1 Tax=Micromonospora sp. NPDC049275 TaxID=3364268 RepID=UPI0037241019
MNFDQLFSNFGDLSIQGLAQGAIYALFALGYTMVYGVLRLINFAHSEVFMVGTFGAIVVWNWLGLDQNSPVPAFVPALLYLLVGLLAACLTSGVTAVVLERVAYRPLRKRNAPVLTFLITAIGASVVISEAVGIWSNRKPKAAPRLFTQHELFTVAGTTITNLQVFLVLLAVVLMIALDLFINRTRLGRGVRAIAQDPNTAALMGVNKDRVIALVFLLGGIMAGAAALMYNIKITGTHFFAGFDLGIKAFAAAVLGGIGNLRGALIGGLLLGMLEGWGSGLLGTQWTGVVAFVVLILILLFRPTGLLGESLGRSRA